MLLNTSSHAISREQLGRQSWTLLHMISGQMPDAIDDMLRDKINIFLNLLYDSAYSVANSIRASCAEHTSSGT